MSALSTCVTKIGKLFVSHFLLWVPLVLWLFPFAAYWEYGPGRQLYVLLAILIPILTLITYVMVRYHLEYREAYQDNTALLNRLTKEGSKVQATVVEVSQSNAYINEMPVLKITIQYFFESVSYQKTIPKVVSYDNLHLITEGSTRWVWIDRQNPRLVVMP